MTTLQAVPRLPSRTEVAQAHRARGGLIAAALPIHIPRALLRAHGILPIEVWGPPGVNPTGGAARLQPYVCSVVTNALSFLESGGLDIADLILVPHACDSLQGLASILIDFVRPRKPVVPFYLPRGRRDCDLDYLAAELRSMAERLGEIAARSPDAEAFQACLEREAEADEHLAALQHVRDRLPLCETEITRLVRSREYLPAEDFTSMAGSVLSLASPLPRPGLRIILSGIVPEPSAILHTLDGLGVVIASDDLACCGRRLYRPGRHADPYRRQAESLLSGPPDPTLGSPLQARLDHLVQLSRDGRARGVVFCGVKFCEPELFDLPRLRAGLQQAGLPSLAIEVDLNDPEPSQVMTRLEAFVEMIA